MKNMLKQNYFVHIFRSRYSFCALFFREISFLFAIFFRLANVLLINYTHGNIYGVHFVAATQSFMKFKIGSFCFGGALLVNIFFRFFFFDFGFRSIFSLNGASSKKIHSCKFLNTWMNQGSNEMSHWVDST